MFKTRIATIALATLCIIAAVGTARSDAQTSSAVQFDRIAASAIKADRLKSLIIQVRVDGKDIYTRAWGESMGGVPATPQMHFRNGAMAFTYMSTMLMELVDRHKASLNDPLAKYFPNLPHAREVTLKNLANMTSGYADYVYQPEVLRATALQPFRRWTNDELIDIGVSKPMQFKPGTNWGYCHTNYVILAGVLEKITGIPLAAGMNEFIIKPMGLAQTRGFDSPYIPEPVLHTFSSERRALLRIPATLPFYEDSTFWDPSWTTAKGAVQVTDIADLARSMEAVGTGALLSRQSFNAQAGSNLVGFGHAQAGCAACRYNSKAFNYGLGVINVGPWVTQTKIFAGSGAAVGYLRSHKLTVAVATTYLPSAFDGKGDYKDASDAILVSLANVVAPGTISIPK